MKKFLAAILTAVLIISGFTAVPAFAEEEQKIKVTSSIYPIYDWVNQVIGERSEKIDHELLLKSSIDLHSYQPSVEDMVRIAESDLFLFVGGHSDKWVADALEQANEDLEIINLMEVLGDDAKLDAIVEGMEHNHDHDHDHNHDHEPAHDHDHEHSHEGIDALDEHVWLSLRNAEKFVKAIAEKLSEVDPEGEEIYHENAKAYIKELKALDKKYQKAVGESEVTTLIVADRFPFRYLFNDYAIDYYAAFSGCSAESEASFEMVAFLSDKLEELNLDNLLVLENSSEKVAESIIKNSNDENREIIVLDSLQSLSDKDLTQVDSYLESMEQNLEALKKALGVNAEEAAEGEAEETEAK